MPRTIEKRYYWGKDAEGFPSNLPEDFLTGLAQAKIACAFFGLLEKMRLSA